MAVVLACLVMVSVAVVLTVRWRRVEFAGPAAVADGWRGRLRVAVWWVEVALATVLFSGILVIGAGGRLAMRLLGALGGDRAQGRLTEADEVVGEITVGGTIGFIVFVGVVGAVATVILYLLLRRYLPAGVAGGAAFGAGLLVVVGTRSDPLRPENRDFDLVGPWWVSLAVFVGLALLHGAATSVFVNRFSTWLPLPGRDRRSAAYLLLLLLVPVFPLGIAASVFVAVFVVAGDAVAWLTSRLSAPRSVLVGRAVLAGIVLVALPGFVTGVVDIAGRGPSLG